MKSLQIAAWILVTALVAYLLIVAKQLLIPLLVALSFWFLINTIAEYLGRLRLAGFRLPASLAILIATVFIIAMFAFSIDLILRTIDRMAVDLPAYERTLNRLIADVVTSLDIEETPSVAMLIEQIDLRPLVINLGASISNLAGKLILIIVYVIFLLLEERFFKAKFRAVFPTRARYVKALRILDRIETSIKIYLTVKTFVSVLTGLLSYVALRLIGVNNAEFWGFLIFLMNFIPSIGSIVATALVSLFALLQFEHFSPFFLTLATIGAIQLAVGNYLDPRLMGRSLNISPLVVLFSLVLWGAVWGIIGMVLSVPITVILLIILSQFPTTAPVAILLSQNGRILQVAPRLPRRRPPRRETQAGDGVS